MKYYTILTTLFYKSEQGSLDWTKSYGYCDNIDDDRGYTLAILGATTGSPNDTDPDAPTLFKVFDAASTPQSKVN
ncbi:chitosanase [Paenibacillus sp. FA6]|uniref:chitosanase n=1 Tax=Paenibacillus sp. FA6 TaxID=3413029 RepID=UPI003F655267